MSKYFSVEELTRSWTASELKIDNTPNTDQTNNLILLIDIVLDPIRELWAKPIYVNSGFRSDALNKAVNGVPNSQHLKGQAADINTGSVVENEELFNIILNSDIEFDQLIDEKNFGWIHISYNYEGNRKQILHLN